MAERADAPAVLLQGVCKRFGERVILNDLSLRAEPGERIALVGESGSGKSTLLNIIAGLEPADSGRVEVAGHLISGQSDDDTAALRRKLIGFAFQAFHLLGHLNVVRNVAVPLLLDGVAASDALERAASMLSRLGLANRLSAAIRELSGGEQQRVALARALVAQPKLLLADEPTGNLDPDNARAALALIVEQSRETGAALLLVTHSHDAAAMADRQLALRHGRLEPA
ncbi:MAG: ABC transporter ATP-binding protein [Betaproteobacteria bacterium]|nr:ABC transporter ATP-binding protein [Betaproteobacteria bacterium]